MPNSVMKSFAEKTGKKTKTVEKLWKKCEKIVKKEYDIDEKSERFYPLVVGCLKNLLGLNKEQEDVGITTANLGSATFAPKISDIMTRQPLSTDPSKVVSEIKIKKIKKLKEAAENLGIDLDDVISDNISFYSQKSEDVVEIIEMALDASAKYLKVEPSIFDKN